MSKLRDFLGATIFIAYVTYCEGETDDTDKQDGKIMYCFQCKSSSDLDCAKIQKSDTDSVHYKPCMDTEKYNGRRPFCRKIEQNIYVQENLKRIVRKCSWLKDEEDCYTKKHIDREETICQCFTPGCNGSSSLKSSLLMLSLLSTLATFIKGYS